MFQSTRPHGARRRHATGCQDVLLFQSTRPHGARPARHVGSRGLCLCFNPRARTGRDSRDTLSGRVYRSVSIHAPARGATTDIPSECCTNAFQSTRPHGARPMHEAGKPAFVRVSIHAPARGATSASDVRQAAATGFNPRARTGRDWSRAALISSIDLFQSTRPHGARPSASMALACFSSFQSTRPHGARRPPTLPQFVALCVSIHAPARGATGIFRMLPSCAGCFNPRARTGRDEISAILLQLVLMFQSTRPHGARPRAPGRTLRFQRRFNPRARTGRDANHRGYSSQRTSFNPRARTGRDGRPRCKSACPSCFNPRARTGRDPCAS